MFDVVPELADVVAGSTLVAAPTFGKWDAVRAVTGPAPTLVVAGVSTDCVVLSTVLAAAVAGATGAVDAHHAAASASARVGLPSPAQST